jgi:hypothetical protein
LRGWQSNEDEIDAVGTPQCDGTEVVADAGPDQTGRQGKQICFDGSGSSGDISHFGWDFDGDGAVDANGAVACLDCTTGREGDATLFVTGTCGNVASDSAHFTCLPPLDNFLCYKTKTKQPISVNLADELDTGTYTSKGEKLFCTPADDGSGIDDPATHLAGWKISGPHTPRPAVTVTNPFGTLVLTTKKATTLLVPSSKSLPPTPPPGPPGSSQVDHYRCVSAKIAKGTPKFPKDVTAAVADQFGSRTALVKKPSRLCVPTNKNGEGLKNPTEALMCYKIKADVKTPFEGVQVNNQFGPVTLDVKKEVELCVPSTETLGD